MKHMNIKIPKGIVILINLRRYVPGSILRMLFYSFTQPNFDLGLLFWSISVASNLRSIQSKVNKAVRKMLFKNQIHPTEQLFNELKTLNLEKQRILTNAGFMWKVANKEFPKTIRGHFKRKKKEFL